MSQMAVAPAQIAVIRLFATASVKEWSMKNALSCVGLLSLLSITVPEVTAQGLPPLFDMKAPSPPVRPTALQEETPAAQPLAPPIAPALPPANSPLMTTAVAASDCAGTPIAGAAVYILSPYFDGNPAFTTTTGIGTNSPHQSTTDFSWTYNATPAFWLGWLNGNGFGGRGHYFFYDQQSRTTTTSLSAADAASSSIAPPPNLASPAGSPTFGSPGVILGNGLGQDVLAFRSDLKIQAIDMEASQLVTGGGAFALISGGARYLHMSQDYQATLSNVLPPPASASESQLLQFGHNFTGAGPTLNIVAGYQVGGIPLSLFGDVRGSFLVGGARTSRNFALNVNDPNGVVGGNQFANPTADARRGATLPIIEAELGLQYAPTVFGRTLQLRGGAVHQTYFGAGSASQTAGNLSLFGGQISAGLLY